ncbi:hypothetical protein BH10BAC3_BH10BAC3_11810 [soil metagenome]
MGNFFTRVFGSKEPPASKLPGEKVVDRGSPDNKIAIPCKSVTDENSTDLLHPDFSNSPNGIEADTELPLQSGNPEDEPGKEKVEPPVIVYDDNNYIYPEPALFNSLSQEILSAIHSNPDEFDLPILWSQNEQQIILKDLVEIKNILIVGTQATGKTTFLHQVIISLLLKHHPSKLKIILADSKGLDLGVYRAVEKQFLAKTFASNPILNDRKGIVENLNSLAIEMDSRYDLLKEAGVRNIKEYNYRFLEQKLNPVKGHQFLPFLVFIVDDLGGFANTHFSEILRTLNRIVTEGYKVGIFTVISTSQIDGQLLPNNLLSMITQRAVFRLNSKAEYRRFFDTARIEIPSIAGGFLFNDFGRVHTGQSISFSDSEIQSVVGHISLQDIYPSAFLLPEYVDERELEANRFDLSDRDKFFDEAARLIVQNQIGSTSLIQRRLKLGYNQAGRLMDQLEAAGIVGANQGSKAREVLVRSEMELEEILDRL